MSSNFKGLKSKGTKVDKLIDQSLTQLKESREVEYEKKSKRFRIDKSLTMSDDNECHQIRNKILQCKKFQKVHLKKRSFCSISYNLTAIKSIYPAFSSETTSFKNNLEPFQRTEIVTVRRG